MFAARRGVEPDADNGRADQIRDALRAGAAAICRYKRPHACDRAFGAPDEQCTNAQVGLGSDPDIVRRDE